MRRRVRIHTRIETVDTGVGRIRVPQGYATAPFPYTWVEDVDGGWCVIERIIGPTDQVAHHERILADVPITTGLGDVIHSALTRMRVVRLAKRLFRNCGCERRRALLNRLFPFRRGSDTMAALPDDRANPTPEQGGHV